MNILHPYKEVCTCNYEIHAGMHERKVDIAQGYIAIAK